MDITHRTMGNVHILRLDGRFDAYEVPAVVAWFDVHADVKNLVINLSGVDFIDSSGLSTLVKGLKRCRQNDGDLYLCSLQEALYVIFELTRLNEAFTLFDQEADAIAAFAP